MKNDRSRSRKGEKNREDERKEEEEEITILGIVEKRA